MERNADVGDIDVEGLAAAAREAQQAAYAPYSRFAVGAAILADSGRVYRGCNVENASYPVTVCAERAALCAAVVAGERSFRAIAVYVDGPGAAMPCGLCRQALAEFGLDTLVIAASADGTRHLERLAELLPDAFLGDALADAGQEKSR